MVPLYTARAGITGRGMDPIITHDIRRGAFTFRTIPGLVGASACPGRTDRFDSRSAAMAVGGASVVIGHMGEHMYMVGIAKPTST